MKHYTEGSAGLVTLEFPPARKPLQGWQCAIYRHLPDGTEELMKDVANVLIRVDAGETVTAGVTVANVDGNTLIYEQSFYDVVEVRVRGAAHDEQAVAKPGEVLADLAGRGLDRLRPALDSIRSLTHRICSGFPGVE